MSGKAIRETLGFLAVVASMVFVGLEISQNTSATRSATQNAIYDAGRQGTFALFANAPLMEVVLAVENDPSLLDSIGGTMGGRLYQALWVARFNEMENAFLHHREGTLSAEAWAGWEGYIIERASAPSFGHYWELYQGRFGGEFRAMIDGLLANP